MINLIFAAMETPLFTSQPIAIVLLPLAVVVLAVLVYAFGFQKSVEPPSFKQLNSSADDKKSKKKKIKDKKPQSNGHAVVIDVADAKKAEPTKAASKVIKAETPKQKKLAENKKAEAPKSPIKKEKKENNENKNKKKTDNEKPADFDEGEWESAPLSRKDKKKQKGDQEIVLAEPEKHGKKSPLAKKEIAKKIEEAIEIKPMEILRIEDILPPKPEETPAVVVKPATEVKVPVAVAPVPEVVVPAVTPAPADDQGAKKKKAKKPKVSASEEDVVVPQVVPAPTSSPDPVPVESSQVFNELDAWQEAPQKKSKKKARKD